MMLELVMELTPLAAIIVVGWNNRRDLQVCFNALQNQDYGNYRIIYVDNASADDSVTFVRENFPEIIVLPQSENLLFGPGNHVGIMHAKGLGAKYIGLINADTSCTTNWLSAQIGILESDASVGVVAPKVVFADGFGTTEAKSSQGKYIINTVGMEPGGFLFPYDRGFGELDKGQYDQQEEVYAASGVSLVFRMADYAAAGGFDPRIKMYLEDVDLCLSIKKLGKKVVYTPKTTVYHKHMQSTQQQNNNFYINNSRVNYLLLVYKHYPIKKFLRALWENFRYLTFPKFVYTVVVFTKNLIKS